jgi:hypothetical protein
MSEFKFIQKIGKEIETVLEDFAQLRITVFAEFPYLYEGNLAYEKEYIQTYCRSEMSFFFGIYHQNKLIGATTCLPLVDETEEVKKPFEDAKIDINQVFYFGESIILQKFRGQGFGNLFFDERERYAKQFAKIKFTTFCTVERPKNHPLKPENFRPNDLFWSKRKYLKRPELSCEMKWLDKNETAETFKKLTFWTKTIER